MSDKPLSTSALNAKRVAELKALAAQMGVTLDPKARKADYVQAIKAAYGAGAAEAPASTAPAADGPAGATADDLARKDAAAQAVSELTSELSGRGQGRDAKAPRTVTGAGEAGGEEADNAAEVLEKVVQQAEHEREAATAGNGNERRNRRERTRNRSRQDHGDRSDRNGDRKEQQNRGDRRHQNRQHANDAEQRANDTAHAQAANAGNSANEDVLLPVAGILDIVGTNSYLRTSGYLPAATDAYVSSQIIKKYGLRRGDAIVGMVRSLADSPQRRGQRQHKYNPLVEITAINGLAPEESLQRPEFNKLTPLYPQEMLRTETTRNALTARVIDLVAPIGKGQRGLIVSPPKAGKTIVMQQLAMAIAKNNPEVHLMVVLVDERPEEVTDMQRLVHGEVIASTFDRPASDHTLVSELAVERAKRLVELGQDVVILLDSLTRLSRAYNLAAPASGRILSGGVDAAALYPPKKFFGAARNIENGGSLTIIASALVETGSKMDEVIFEEFKGTGNMELRLSRQLADRRIFPAVDINASGTRREELLFSPEELKIVWQLRRALGTLDVQEASDYLLGRLRKTETNGAFLMSVVRGMQAAGE